MYAQKIAIIFINHFCACLWKSIIKRKLKKQALDIITLVNQHSFNNDFPKSNQLSKVIKLLKNERFDIGFNPWSNGLDSCYFISLCKKFLFYKDFDKPSNINHYQVVRKYLQLPEKKWKVNNLTLQENYTKILVCPHSTDPNRNLPIEKMTQIIFELKKIQSQKEA